MEWEPLPRRHRKRHKSSESFPGSEINDLITLRSQEQSEIATLGDKDGCRGEFYEYLDHTADVQLHAWGNCYEQAFAHIAPCLFNYMTDLSKITVNPDKPINISVSGHDLEALLYRYLDELLYLFSVDGFCCVSVAIQLLDMNNFVLEALAYGDIFDRRKHTQGTEIKAITYSNMQIHRSEDTGRVDIYVIVDI